MQAGYSIKTSDTGWTMSMEESDWKDKIYHNLFIEDSRNITYIEYWLSSRNVNPDQFVAAFNVNKVNNLVEYLCYSNGDEYECLRFHSPSNFSII